MYISKRVIVLVLILFACFVAGLLVIIPKKAKAPLLSSTSPVSQTPEDIPECYMFQCPQYLNSEWTVYGPGPGASVIVVPTAMTKGAGQVLIIHGGKVVYKSPELAEIDAKIDPKDSSKLYISYVSEWQEDGLHPKTEKTDQLIFNNDKFEMVKYSTLSF